MGFIVYLQESTRHFFSVREKRNDVDNTQRQNLFHLERVDLVEFLLDQFHLQFQLAFESPECLQFFVLLGCVIFLFFAFVAYVFAFLFGLQGRRSMLVWDVTWEE